MQLLPPEQPSPDIKDLILKGADAYKEERYTDAILAWQDVLTTEPGAHPDIEAAMQDAIEKMRSEAES